MEQMHPNILLADIFPNKSKEVIENIIRIVEENQDLTMSSEEKFEVMVNLLTETGISEFSGDSRCQSIEVNKLLDEAAGFHVNSDGVSNLVKGLYDIFPDADPTYLERNAKTLALDKGKLEDFINNHIENKTYPTMEDYLKKKNERAEMDKYLFHFRLYQFLLEFPDPISYFTDSGRQHAFTNVKENEILDLEKEFTLKCLYNQFCYLRESDIKKVLKICGNNIVKAYYKLKNIQAIRPAFKIPRNTIVLPDVTIKNILLLQEIAFIQNEANIMSLKKEKEQNFLRAKELGLLETCSCCYSEDLIPEDCFLCKSGCRFCKECIRKAAEIAYAEGKTEFSCLSDCGSDYSLLTLQMVLNPKIFSNLCHRIQMQEINNANIPGLEKCPLCFDFATIPAPNDKIFHCDICTKDSCRECKHEAHLPKRCNEIEYEEDVKMRTYIENKMTDALLRKCYKCDKTFIKNTGCNKIVCSCGAMMCYICRSAISDYSHFSNSGCPLFTNDEQIHLDNVMKGANNAKVELGVDRNPEKLKFDPTKDFKMNL